MHKKDGDLNKLIKLEDLKKKKIFIKIIKYLYKFINDYDLIYVDIKLDNILYEKNKNNDNYDIYFCDYSGLNPISFENQSKNQSNNLNKKSNEFLNKISNFFNKKKNNIK